MVFNYNNWVKKQNQSQINQNQKVNEVQIDTLSVFNSGNNENTSKNYEELNLDNLLNNNFNFKDYNEISSKLFNATKGKIGTDKNAVNEIVNNESLSGSDWVNIIQTYENSFSSNLINDLEKDYSGITENNKRNEIMKTISSKLLNSLENGDEEALNVIVSQLETSLSSKNNKSNEFISNILSGADEINSLILNKYNKTYDKNLIDDIKTSKISKANKDLLSHKLEQSKKTSNETKSSYEELNLDNYSNEDKNKAWTINLLIQGLNSSLDDFQNQNNEDGTLSDNYNIFKTLTSLGVSSEDLVSALTDEENIIDELTKALNNESDLSFEETFKNITGVDYDEEKIIEYQENSNNYALSTNILLKADNFQKAISNADNMEEVVNLYTTYFQNEEKGLEELNKYLTKTYENANFSPEERHISNVQIVKNEETGENELEISYLYQDLSYDENGNEIWQNKNDVGKLDLKDSSNYLYYSDSTGTTNPNGDEYVIKAKNSIIENFNCDYEKIKENYTNSKKEAFGSIDKLEETVNEYCQSQSDFIDKLSSTTQIAGLATVAVGSTVSFINPPVGATLMTAGKYMSLGGMFSNNVLNAVDDISSTNGLTKEKTLDLLKETTVELGYLALGGKINNLSEIIQNGSFEVLSSLGMSENSATALSWLMEGGSDFTLSMLSDIAISGDSNLDSNSLQALMGILTGVASAKTRHLKETKINELEEKISNGELEPKDIENYLSKTHTPDEIAEETNKILDIDESDASYIEEFANNYGLDESQTEVFKKLASSNINTVKASLVAEKGLTLDECDKFIELYNSGIKSEDGIYQGLKSNWGDEQWDIYREISEKFYNKYNTIQFYDISIDYKWTVEELNNYKNYLFQDFPQDMAAILASNSLDDTQKEVEIAKLGLKEYQHNSQFVNMVLRKNLNNSEKAAQICNNFGTKSLSNFITKGYDILSKPTKEDMVVNRYEVTTKDYTVPFKEGDIFSPNGFYSTTSNLSEDSWAATTWTDKIKEEVGDSSSKVIKYEINIPKGTPIVTGDDYMDEVLLKYGSKFKVKSFDPETNTYTLDYIGTNE